MTLFQVGLLDTTGQLDPDLMQSVAAALNIQVTRDLSQFWTIQASVRYLANSNRIPSGVWPVNLVDSLPPGEGGFHLDKHNQPYAEVVASPDDDSWSIDASHEAIEMLVDPNGNRMLSSVAIEITDNAIEDGTGQFNYLVEACDPCEANSYGYQIQGVLVSDFITPHFYDSVATPGTRYSFTGAITRPRQVLPGGYISFVDQATDEWEQIIYLQSSPQLRTLGPASGDQRSMRQWVNNNLEAEHGTELRALARRTDNDVARKLRDRREKLADIAKLRAQQYSGSK
jgi:hypothetical protein